MNIARICENAGRSKKLCRNFGTDKFCKLSPKILPVCECVAGAINERDVAFFFSVTFYRVKCFFLFFHFSLIPHFTCTDTWIYDLLFEPSKEISARSRERGATYNG